MLKNLFKSKKHVEQSVETPVETIEVPDYELQAAIGFALHMYMTELHDFEKTILTIQKVMRPYSPWSSKIYGLRRSPR
jgi:hypothetical protein